MAKYKYEICACEKKQKYFSLSSLLFFVGCLFIIVGTMMIIIGYLAMVK